MLTLLFGFPILLLLAFIALSICFPEAGRAIIGIGAIMFLYYVWWLPAHPATPEPIVHVEHPLLSNPNVRVQSCPTVNPNRGLGDAC